MTPYFERDGATLYHAPCLEVLATMASRSVGIVMTDPPYSERTHKGARSNKGRRGGGVIGAERRGGIGPGIDTLTRKEKSSHHPIDFPSMTDDEMLAAFAEMGRVVRRWLIATVAFEHAAVLSAEPPDGLRAVRVGAWMKIGPTPQMIGDRPAQGWEAVSIMHASDGEKMRWNGGGRAAVWRYQAEMRGDYPTQKPEPLISHLIADFADPDDVILDPFAGGGTMLVCGWRAGHKVIGCDIREQACEVAAKRLEREMAQGRIDLPRRVRAVQPGLAF